MKIGVLALQGAFIEHEKMLRRLGVEAVEIRLPKDLDGVDGVIIQQALFDDLATAHSADAALTPVALAAIAEMKAVPGAVVGAGAGVLRAGVLR